MTDKVMTIDEFLKMACFVLAILVVIVGVWLFIVFRKARQQRLEERLRSMGTTHACSTFKFVGNRADIILV